MAFLKQLLMTLVVLVIAGAVWIHFDERPGQYLLESGIDLPEPVREAIAALAPDEMSVASTENAAPGAQRSGPDGAGSATLVVADAVTTAVTRDSLKAIGTAEAVQSVAVYPEVTGFIEEVAVQSGDAVEAGELLVSLDDDEAQLAYDRALIALQAAREQLARFEQLAESRTVSSVQVDEARRQVQSATLDVRAAQIALRERQITAPISGRVGIIEAEPGDLVSNQAPVATIDDRSRLKVVFYVPEAFVPALEIGQPVEAVSVAWPGEVFEGTIAAIDSRLDETSRTLRTQAVIDNPDDALRPGMSFTIGLDFEGEEQLSVDPLAIQWERAGPFVWTIEEDSTVAKAPIRIIERNVDRVLVASNALEKTDSVVVEGVLSVREGAAVRVENAVQEDDGAPSVPVPTSPEGVVLKEEDAQPERRSSVAENHIEIVGTAEASVLHETREPNE